MTVLSIPAAGAPAQKSRIRASLNKAFNGLRQAFVIYLEQRSRFAEIEVLNQKTDQELAEMGLKRENITRYVFRDLVGL